MQRLTYAAVIAFIAAGSLWLEVVVRTRVLRRTRRAALSILPVLAVFLVWDAWAIHTGHWTFDASQVLGWHVVAGIPLEEVLFFVVVPLASILTFEAVRAVRGWPAGDEPTGASGDRS